jgi:DNA-binding NtrC family response regulator
MADDELVAESVVAAPPDLSRFNGAARHHSNGKGPSFEVHVGTSIPEVEQSLIVATLEHTHGDKPAAAMILDISLKTLYTRLKNYKSGPD